MDQDPDTDPVAAAAQVEALHIDFRPFADEVNDQVQLPALSRQDDIRKLQPLAGADRHHLLFRRNGIKVLSVSHRP